VASESLESSIEVLLETLDITTLAEWDVLVFLYRHRTSLASAEHITRLLGYTTTVVGGALDKLESRNIVHRSRASQGVRMYQFSDLPDPFLGGVRELVSLAETRTGRLLLARKLRERASRGSAKGRAALHLVRGRRAWPKAI
jgi:hypothetical protein